MKYRYLGQSGLRVSEISLGSWLTIGDKLGDKASHGILKEAVEQGINFLDTADTYADGNAERVIGSFLKDYERSDIVLSSKVFWEVGKKGPNDFGLGRKHIFESIDRSLERLQTDYLDMYFCHHFDLRTPLEETILAMTDLVENGNILYWGTSVWHAHQIERVNGLAKSLGAVHPVVEQSLYNMLNRKIELEVIDSLRYWRMGLAVWSPLFSGILTGKYISSIPEGSRAHASGKTMNRFEIYTESIEKLIDVAKDIDITMSQMALAWVLRMPNVSTAITGASKPAQVKSNSSACEVSLNSETLTRIDDVLGNKPELEYPYNANQELFIEDD
ncbi:MAG: aldo/keto reductase [Candidatus Thorarchaeota archaeon]|jgi:aryl-alcohol dehydrogenase-like predicted oxidoreductase